MTRGALAHHAAVVVSLGYTLSAPRRSPQSPARRTAKARLSSLAALGGPKEHAELRTPWVLGAVLHGPARHRRSLHPSGRARIEQTSRPATTLAERILRRTFEKS